MGTGYVPFRLNLSRRKWDEENQSRLIPISRAYHVILAISRSFSERTPNPPLDFIRENSAIFVQDSQPGS